MNIFADLHTHFYPQYNYPQAWEICFERFLAHQKEVSDSFCVLALTETQNCNFYSSLAAGQVCMPQDSTIIQHKGCMQISKASQKMLIFPGRQLNTKERVELLSLGSDQIIPSGASLIDSLDQILEIGAIPVINWAPGKWWFKRGGYIKEIIKSYPKTVLLGDTSLRPLGYPTPSLMRFGLNKGRKIIYGSDPLPHVEEQKNLVSYISRYQFNFNINEPLNSFIEMLTTQSAKPFGKRSSFLELAKRLYRYYSSR